MREVHLSSMVRGTLQISSNSRVIIGKNSTVIASVNSDDYYADDSLFLDACNNEFGRGLFFARDRENIEICGEENSIVNGQGFIWRKAPDREKRPFLIRLVGCKNIKLKNLNLVDGASYAISLHDCENVEIENINILSKWGYNDDGIVFSCCRHVYMRNCHVDCGGDAIGFKSTDDMLMKDILVERCIIKTGSDGIKFGIEKGGDIQDITIRDCVFEIVAGAGIKIAPSGMSKVQHIRIENILLGSMGVFVFALSRKGKISDLYIHGLKALSTPSIENCDRRILLIGNQKSLIEDVVLEECEIHVSGGSKSETEYRMVNWNVKHPEPTLLGELPVYGMYVCYANNITVRNVQFISLQKDVRKDILFNVVTNGKIENN